MSNSQNNALAGVADTDFVFQSAYLPRQHQAAFDQSQRQRGAALIRDYRIGTIAPALTIDLVQDIYLKDTTPVALADLVSHSRGSTATFTDRHGVLQTIASDTLRTDQHVFKDGMFQRAGMRVDQQATNLFETSEDFTPNKWQKHNCSVASTQLAAPDRVGTATEMTFDGTSGVRLEYPILLPSAGVLTHSVFLKKGTSDHAFLLISSIDGKTGKAFFNLASGTVGFVDTVIDDAQIERFDDDWYRCSMTMVVSSTSDLGGGLGIWGANADGSTSCNNGETIFVWGAQAEMSATPTSYIKTTGSTVTTGGRCVVDPCSQVAIYAKWIHHCRRRRDRLVR